MTGWGGRLVGWFKAAGSKVLDGLERGAGVALAGVLVGWLLHHAVTRARIEPPVAGAVAEAAPLAAGDEAIIKALLPFYHIDGLTDSTTVALLDWLEKVEGFRSHPYRDQVGVLTVGIGANLETGPGMPRAVALHWALANVAGSCNSFSGSWTAYRTVPEPLRAGLCDASFQLGPTGLEGFHNTLAALADGRCADAVKGIEGSKWASETRNRADRLANLVQRYGCADGLVADASDG